MSVGADEVDELERAGFVFRPDSELTQCYFKQRPGDLRTHVHVRRAGSFNEQFALPLYRASWARHHPSFVVGGRLAGLGFSMAGSR